MQISAGRSRAETVTLVNGLSPVAEASSPHDGHRPFAMGITSVKQCWHSSFIGVSDLLLHDLTSGNGASHDSLGIEVNSLLVTGLRELNPDAAGGAAFAEFIARRSLGNGIFLPGDEFVIPVLATRRVMFNPHRLAVIVFQFRLREART
jgi:hypothetical protein